MAPATGVGFFATTLKPRIGGCERRVNAALAAAREGVFGVLFTIARDPHAHTWSSIFGICFDFVQLMSYPLYSGAMFPWKSISALSPLLAFLKYCNPSNAADAIGPTFKIALLLLASLWIACTIGAVGWAAFSFARGDFSSLLPLRFLRATAKLTTTALFVPFATILMSVYRCSAGDEWGNTNWGCFGAAHSTAVAVVSLILPVYCLFSLTVSAVFFDRDYASHNIVAKPHGVSDEGGGMVIS